MLIKSIVNLYKILIFSLLFSYSIIAYGQNESFKYPISLSDYGVNLPNMEDKQFLAKLNNPQTIYYKLPQVWQHYIPASNIIHKNTTLDTVSFSKTKKQFGIHYSDYLQTFNANKDFPWEGTVGLNSILKNGEDPNITTINFLILPKNNGQIIPILVIYEVPIKWIFPCDTIVGEIIMVKHDDQWWIQEIRARQKNEDSIAWEPIIYRPIGTRKELLKILKIDEDNYPAATKYMFFRNPEEDEVFKMEGFVERLPDLSSDIVKKLLSLPFKNVTYEAWSEISTAPCSDQEFNIVPANYNLGLISPDPINCAGCHRQTQISVRNLIPKEPLVKNNFEKVGNIRGCDSVFTWFPWEKTSILNEPQSISNIYTEFREYDIKNNVILFKDSRKITKVDTKLYKLTYFVQESLKDYELPPEQYLHQKTE